MAATTATAIGFDVTVEEIMGRGRHEHIVVARMASYWLLRTASEMSYQGIGLMFDRDHNAIISGCRKIQGLIDAESKENGFLGKMGRSHKEFINLVKKYHLNEVSRKRKEFENALELV